MIYNTLGNSDIKVSAITFGAWAIGGWMWGGTDKADALKAINSSYDFGITTIDTAPVYGFGLSEEIVGEAIKGRRDRFQILTKYGLSWYSKKGVHHFDSEDENGNAIHIYKYASKERIIKECEDSLKRLGTDYIDLYQIHWPDDSTPLEETFEAIQSLQKQGKIRAAGVCNYSLELFKRTNEHTDIVTNQVHFSMVQRKIEQDLMPFCEETNKGVIAYSPLQRGLLTGKITENYKFNKGDNRPDTAYFRSDNLRRTNIFLSKIKAIADDKGCTLSQLVINWTLSRPAMATVLVGARNAKQASENAKAIDYKLTESDLTFINDELDKLVLDI